MIRRTMSDIRDPGWFNLRLYLCHSCIFYYIQCAHKIVRDRIISAHFFSKMTNTGILFLGTVNFTPKDRTVSHIFEKKMIFKVSLLALKFKYFIERYLGSRTCQKFVCSRRTNFSFVTLSKLVISQFSNNLAIRSESSQYDRFYLRILKKLVIWIVIDFYGFSQESSSRT